MDSTTPMPDTVHHLKIALKNVQPPIWREVLVPSDLRLDRLHHVIQIAMGWEDEHMHEFIVGSLRNGERFGQALPDPFGFGAPTRNETKFTLQQIAPSKGGKFLYWYDFGDDWYHEISVKAVLPATPDLPVPRCLKSAGGCPPEDCGGPWGYANLLAILAEPEHEEHEEMREWIGDDFDPARFDFEAVNRALATLANRWNRAPRKRKPNAT